MLPKKVDILIQNPDYLEIDWIFLVQVLYIPENFYSAYSYLITNIIHNELHIRPEYQNAT